MENGLANVWSCARVCYVGQLALHKSELFTVIGGDDVFWRE